MKTTKKLPQKEKTNLWKRGRNVLINAVLALLIFQCTSTELVPVKLSATSNGSGSTLTGKHSAGTPRTGGFRSMVFFIGIQTPALIGPTLRGEEL